MTDVNEVQSTNAFLSIISSLEVGVNVTEFKFVQPSNALKEILVTIFPIVTPINLSEKGGLLVSSDGPRNNSELNGDRTIGVEVISAV
jgi:hypothetical protein